MHTQVPRPLRTLVPPAHIAMALLHTYFALQNAYLAASLARLTEAATAAFPGSTSRPLPSAADLQKAIARVHEELKAATGGCRVCACLGWQCVACSWATRRARCLLQLAP